MQRVGFAGVSALFCIVFLLLSCDINPMTETVIRDPVTVRFYSGETFFVLIDNKKSYSPS